jgi:hypothetical protein
MIAALLATWDDLGALDDGPKGTRRLLAAALRAG